MRGRGMERRGMGGRSMNGANWSGGRRMRPGIPMMPGGPTPGNRNPGMANSPLAMPLPPSPVFIVLDTNKNGEISADELAASSEKLKGLDKNKDGKLTLDELSPMPPTANRNPAQGTGDWTAPSWPSNPNVPQPPIFGGAPVPPMIPPQVGPATPESQATPNRRPDGFIPPMSAPRGAGGVSPRYATPGFIPGAIPMVPPNPETMLNTVWKFDRDGDGKLSRDEFLAFARQMTNRSPEARGGDTRGSNSRGANPRGDSNDPRGGGGRDAAPRDPRGGSNARGTANRESQSDSAPQRESGRPDASTDRKSDEPKRDAIKLEAPERDEKAESADGDKRSQSEDKEDSVKVDGVVEVQPVLTGTAATVESIVQTVANPEIAKVELTPNIPPAVEATPTLDDVIAPASPPATVEQDKDLQ